MTKEVWDALNLLEQEAKREGDHLPHLIGCLGFLAGTASKTLKVTELKKAYKPNGGPF